MRMVYAYAEERGCSDYKAEEGCHLQGVSWQLARETGSVKSATQGSEDLNRGRGH
jgi:hypothetical protein